MTDVEGAAGPSFLVGAAMLSTAAALVVYAVSGVSLLGTAVVVLLIATVIVGRAWHRSRQPERLVFRQHIRVGMLSGMVALVAYNASRWSLVHVARFRFRPFDIFTAFGQALANTGNKGWWVTTMGVAFHVANGLGFSLAYTIWLGRRGPLAGLLFALGLEAAMLVLYPSWLRIQMMAEFVQVSLLGHVAFGLVLGWSARRWLAGTDRLPVPSLGREHVGR